MYSFFSKKENEKENNWRKNQSEDKEKGNKKCSQANRERDARGESERGATGSRRVTTTVMEMTDLT